MSLPVTPSVMNFVQAQPFALAGSGASIGDTTIILQSMVGIDGNTIVTADLGSFCYGTLEPGNGTQEESIQFTAITQNANGTATLTGVSSLGYKQPYTVTSGLTKTHAGASKFILSNDASFYNTMVLYMNSLAIAGASNASTTVKGIVEIATTAEINAGTGTGGTGAVLAISPDNFATSIYASLTPSGLVSPYAGRTAPTGWLLCDGTAYSRSTYASLFAAIAPSGTFTVTIASPAVFSKTAHGLVAGDKVSLTTTIALPTGLAANTDYYVISAGLTADAFEVSASLGGSAVNTSGSQSGVHTIYASNWGKGDGSTTFNVPDYRGFTAYGYKTSDTNFDIIKTPSVYVGEKTHQLVTAELASHSHTIPIYGGGGSGSGNPASTVTTSASTAAQPTGTTGSDTAHNNMPPYLVTQYIIKT